jgi:hypothetical protein
VETRGTDFLVIKNYSDQVVIYSFLFS